MSFSKDIGYLFIVPAILVALAAGALFAWGLTLSTDLAGGSIMQVEYQGARPEASAVHDAVSTLGLESRVQSSGASGYLLRQRDLSQEEHQQLLRKLRALGPMQELQFASIGPSIGQEVLRKGLIAFGLVVVCIILFIAFAFRHVSKPVQSWKYGVVTVTTLLFDVLVPVGLFAYLGHTQGAEVDSLFIVALLAILGISINDKIVVFDRIRENLRLNEEHRKHEPFPSVVGRSVRQTIARSINTSLTVVIVLAALWLVGPASTRDFALVLMAGMIVGTYSSIFLASPLLVLWERLQNKEK